MAEAKTVKKTIKKASMKKAPASSAINNSFAIIETGGKQYGVTLGDTIKIEKIMGDYKVGDKVDFDKVLVIEDAEVKLGAPYIMGSKVSATISEIGRNAKVTVIKYKQKSRYFKKNGHRQPFFKVQINSIA